jgi:PRTRC genetic system ThiF family protein
MSYTIDFSELQRNPTVVVVGVGGTGSLVADGLCRLLTGTDVRLILDDYDIVEEHNLLRQAFYAGDVGKFKAQVLAERLSRQYGRPVGYTIFPFEKDIFDEHIGAGMIHKAMNMLIIGCTDNAAARRKISESMKWTNCWIDSGNGHSSGQVLIGNTNSKAELRECFDEDNKIVKRLPTPSLQSPMLLIPPTVPEKPRDCAEAVVDNDQNPIINQAMATLVLDFVWKLLSGKLTHMGAYIDMDAGTLHYVPANPVTVSRMFSIKVGELMMNKCALGARYHTPVVGITRDGRTIAGTT